LPLETKYDPLTAFAGEITVVDNVEKENDPTNARMAKR
jgi:hypothetical protein